MDRVTLTVTETAKLLGIGRGQAYDAVRRGEIHAIRLGKRLVVPKAAIDRLLEGKGRSGGA
jgi:excisionase family DNA binding protein